jgi:hypothetical protein
MSRNVADKPIAKTSAPAVSSTCIGIPHDDYNRFDDIGLNVKKQGAPRPPRHSDRRHVLTVEDRRHRIGRVQRQCRRALIARGRVTIRDLLAWAFPRAPIYLPWMRTSVHRAIKKFGVPVRPTRKRYATTWELRTE